jgi:hypothetical protein
LYNFEHVCYNSSWGGAIFWSPQDDGSKTHHLVPVSTPRTLCPFLCPLREDSFHHQSFGGWLVNQNQELIPQR